VLTTVEGEFFEAQRLLAEREERTSQGIPFLDQFIVLSREQGRPSDPLPALEDAIAQLDGRYTEPGFEEIMIFYRIFQTLLLLDTRQEYAARRIFEDLAGDGLQNLELDSDWLLGMTLLAEASVLLADRKRAAELDAALKPYRDRVAASAFSLTCTGAVAHYLGLLATLLERWDEAETNLERALEMNARMGARPFTAWTEFAYADMLTKRGRAGDRQRAEALLEQSVATAGELGMVRLQKHAEPLVELLQPGNGTRGDDLHGLTPRQVEVLRLVAEGLSDREIGERLFISHHTVMRHLANIFNTLGVNSRTAAVAYALRHDLL
jgi:ATP/maltotriose-dependent transcriptional regulator MalT